ncbi:MAG: hypothetical protein Q8L69_07410, partial [Gallionellaceae bacterium]|nr:hypothetical protein [Gallionellaceae bacterium]
FCLSVQRDSITKPFMLFRNSLPKELNSTTLTTHAGSLLVYLATTTRHNRINTRPPFSPYPKSASTSDSADYAGISAQSFFANFRKQRGVHVKHET